MSKVHLDDAIRRAVFAKLYPRFVRTAQRLAKGEPVLLQELLNVTVRPVVYSSSHAHRIKFQGIPEETPKIAAGGR